MENNEPTEQEFYNEIMQEAYEEEKARDAKTEIHNTVVLKQLLDEKGFNFVAAFLSDFLECECYGDISFCEKPTGKAQSDTWGKTKGVYVDQHCDGEDSYWGDIYWPVSEGRYIKCHFSC
jgi:hypothetical protein